jgi:hypothetical protein
MKVDVVEGVDVDRSPVSNGHLLVGELTHRVTNEFGRVWLCVRARRVFDQRR